MTTCDPAAYLDAYTFIKMALYRRLARIFGPEYVYYKFKDPALLAVIQAFVSPENGQSAQKVTDLLDRIDHEAPQRKYLVEETIARFQPRVVVNMAADDDDVGGLIQRMHKVSQLMLSMDLKCAGTIPVDRNVAKSAQDLQPEIARHPDGDLAKVVAKISDQI